MKSVIKSPLRFHGLYYLQHFLSLVWPCINTLVEKDRCVTLAICKRGEGFGKNGNDTVDIPVITFTGNHMSVSCRQKIHLQNPHNLRLQFYPDINILRLFSCSLHHTSSRMYGHTNFRHTMCLMLF